MQVTNYPSSFFNDGRQIADDRLAEFSDEKKEYLSQRLVEFLDSCIVILGNRLQPNCYKVGKGIFIGSCPFEIFNWYCTQQPNCKITSRTLYQTRDGVRTPTRRWYYKWTDCVPCLMKENWHIRYHGDGDGNFSSQCRSFYTSLTLIISEEDYRVWANFTQVTQALWNPNDATSWYDV